MSFLDKIKAKYDGKLKEDEAAKWTTIATYVSSASITGGFPLGISPSGSAWVDEVELQSRCRVLMKKLNITTAAEFDEVFGEIISE